MKVLSTPVTGCAIIKTLLIFLLILNAAGFTAQEHCKEIEAYYDQLPNVQAFKELSQHLESISDHANAAYILEQKLSYHPEDEIIGTTAKIALLKSKGETTPCGCDVLERPKWTPTNGPLGADATAFYLDKEGGYWLGTGSSGGVYYSADQGASWEERNTGIGPCHISNMHVFSDTMFIQVNHIGPTKDGAVRYYYWNNRSRDWHYIPGEIGRTKARSTGKAYAVFDSFRQLEDSTKRTTHIFNLDHSNRTVYSMASGYHYQSRGVHPMDYVRSEYDIYYESRIFGYRETSSAKAKLNRGFPRDMFRLPGGNQFNLNGKNAVLLSKSGVYFNKNDKMIKPLGKIGLVATDVRQLITKKDGSLYGLVNEADIWKYQNDQWVCVFNAYEHHTALEDPISFEGYDTKQLNLQTDGSILFAFCGKLWKLDPEDKASPFPFNTADLINDDKLKHVNRNTLDHSRVVVSSGVRDINGDYYLSAQLATPEQDNTIPEQVLKYQIINVLVQVKDGKASVVETNKDHELPYVFGDYSGKIWYKSEKAIRAIGSTAKTDQYLKVGYEAGWIAEIAFRSGGDFAVNATDGIYIWKSTKEKWEILVEDRYLEGVTCLGFGSDGALYAGTGELYSVSCGDDDFESISNGVFIFKNDRWSPLLNGPNTWIYSLATHPTDGLFVGTSGSGVQLLNSKK